MYAIKKIIAGDEVRLIGVTLSEESPVSYLWLLNELEGSGIVQLIVKSFLDTGVALLYVATTRVEISDAALLVVLYSCRGSFGQKSNEKK